MKIRISVREDGRAFATGYVPNGRKFIPVTAVAHDPTGPRESVAKAVTAVYQEVQLNYARKRKGPSEAGGEK